MTLKTIYIARHGFRSNWLPPPHPPPPTGVDSDHPLLEHGEEQAVQLAHYLLSLGDNAPQLIVSSPFFRCIQTSQPISKILSVPIAVERGIGEWFTLERKVHPIPADLDLLSNFFDNLDKDYTTDKFVVPSSKGENEEQVFHRCQVFLEKFIPFINENYPDIERVVLVTHAATKIALGMSLLGYQSPRDLLKSQHIIQNEKRLRAGACSLDRFELGKDGEWNLTMNGNVEFLTKGEEMNWSFEYGFEAGSDEDIKARQLRISKESTAELEDEFDEVYVMVDIPSNQSFSTSSTSQYYNRVLIEELSKSTNGNNHRDGEEENHVIHATNNANMNSNDINKSNQSNLNSLYNSSSLQYSGLNTSEPLFLINQQLYKGEYRKLNGTELIVNDNGDVIAKTKDRILLHKGDFTKRQSDEETKILLDNDLLEDELLKQLPESLQKTNNPNLLEKLLMAKKVQLEREKSSSS